VVGGVLIGVIESMAGFYLPQGWKDVAPYIVLLVVLLLKPEGLFGLARIRKYAWTWVTAQRRLARCKGLSGELPPSDGNERIGQP